MGVVQQASGLFNGTGFTAALPAASSGSNRVVLIVCGNTVVTTPSGFTLRVSQVNFMGHYLFDAAGGGTSYAVTNSSGQGMWYLAEVAAGSFISGSGQNDTSTGTTYSTPANTPTAGDRVLFATIGSTAETNTARTVSGWTNSFVEQADLCQTAGAADAPMGSVATLEVAANGSTAYSTTATYSAASVGRTALITSYATTAGGGTTASPTGIASGDAFGTPAATATLTSSPTGISSGETLGSVVAALVLAVVPAGIPGAESFGLPGISGLLTATPSGIGSDEAFGMPSAGSGIQVSPAGIPSAESLGVPAMSGTLTASPGGVGSAEVFGAPSALAGVAAQPAGIPTGEAFGAPTAIIPRTATPTGIAGAEVFGTPASSGSLTAVPAGVGSGEGFGSPSALLAWVASPVSIASVEAFGSPSNIGGLLTAAPSSIGTAEQFGVPAAFGGIFRDLALNADPLPGRFISEPLDTGFDAAPLEERFMSAAFAGRWSAVRLEGEAMHKEVLVSAGAVEYVGGTVTEVTGKDISAAAFMMSLGGSVNPGAWVAPSVSTAGTTPASRVLKLLVDNTTTRGTYYAWARISDAPEVAPVRFPQEIIVR